MNDNNTSFAPAERDAIENVLHDADILQTCLLAEHVAHVIPSILVILNMQRQVVYMNQRLMDVLAGSTSREVLGKRPGELFDCVHAHEKKAGCGTTEFCCECGAVNAILKSQREKVAVEEECRITSSAGDSYDFRVWASPFHFEGKDYTIFCVADIRHEKRRLALEQTFFHDVNNLLVALVGCSEMIDTSTLPQHVAESIEDIKKSSKELASEIAGHRKLLQAEDGRLTLDLAGDVGSLELVNDLILLAGRMWPDRPVFRRESCEDFVLTTDRSLLFRILLNMVKNAVEASSKTDTISIGCRRESDSGIFSVHNPGFMLRSTQNQVFQRSFSTKGAGRGIGTYSIKLFGEKYLKGKAGFTSSEDWGTTFFISVPLSREEGQ